MMALLVGFTSATAQETQKFTAAKHNEYGLVYSLPVTHFDIEVTAEKIVSKAGPVSYTHLTLPTILRV